MLEDIIRNNGLTGTATEVLAALIAKNIHVVVTTKHSGADTLMALALAGVTSDQADALLAAAEATPKGRRLLGLLDSEGVQWNHPLTVALLDGMVAAVPELSPVRDVLIGMNDYSISLVQQAGLPDPSESDVSDVLILLAKQDALTGIINRSDAAREAAEEEFRSGNSTAASIIAAGEGAF